MSQIVGIEELQLSPRRPKGPLPVLSLRFLEMIRTHGPIEPVVVRKLGDRQYEILSNVETWLAVQRVGQSTLPVEILDVLDDQEAVDILSVSWNDSEIDAIEEAEELQHQLLQFGGRAEHGSINRLAAFSGLNRSYISHALRLLELPIGIQNFVRKGDLSAGHAKLLVSVKGTSVQEKLARQVISEKLSVRATEKLVSVVRAGKGDKLPEQTNKGQDVVRLEQSLSSLLGCSVEISEDTGRLTIDYARDLDVLDGLLKRLGYEE